MTSNPIFCFDFTAPASDNSFLAIKDALNKYCKSWCFQEEQGAETGYLHFQGRFSLKTKSRKGNIPGIVKAHYSPTQSLNITNFDYVMKDDTRTKGPWTDKDEPAYIPLQYRGKLDTLFPYQREIIKICEKFDDRKINLLYCPTGNIGKSTLAHLMRLHLRALVLPPLNDADRLIYTCCNMAMARNIRQSVPIFIDLPRAMNKERLFGLYTAIEVIKQGYLIDTRNHAKEWDMDCPIVWVFTNSEPEISMLSKDRWQLWEVDENKQLVEFKGTTCNNINSTTLAHLEHFDFSSIDNDEL